MEGVGAAHLHGSGEGFEGGAVEGGSDGVQGGDDVPWGEGSGRGGGEEGVDGGGGTRFFAS